LVNIGKADFAMAGVAGVIGITEEAFCNALVFE
jgi:hypothetical protein